MLENSMQQESKIYIYISTYYINLKFFCVEKKNFENILQNS